MSFPRNMTYVMIKCYPLQKNIFGAIAYHLFTFFEHYAQVRVVVVLTGNLKFWSPKHYCNNDWYLPCLILKKSCAQETHSSEMRDSCLMKWLIKICCTFGTKKNHVEFLSLSKKKWQFSKCFNKYKLLISEEWRISIEENGTTFPLF